MSLRRFGFGLLEVIITLAIASIIGTVALTVYNDQIVRSNQESTKHDMVGLMGDFGKYYTQKGSYATRDGKLPNNIQNQIIAWNKTNKNYKFDVYVKTQTPNMLQIVGSDEYSMNSNTQAVCIVAKPRDNTIMSGTGAITVDNHGNSNIGGNLNANILCGKAIPNPFPDPSNDITPKPSPTISPDVSPTQSPIPSPLVSPTNEPAPLPSPTPTVTPTPEPDGNRCYNTSGNIDFSNPHDYAGCTFGDSGDVSGLCDGGTWLRCSGSCNDTILCKPFDTGCSGDCNRAFIYDAPCNGNCNNTTYFIEHRDLSGICGGHCNNLKIILPKSKYNPNNPPSICNINGNSCTYY
jgi:prepilin-type N-terminal cleavage/methylation domain-containing protein